MMDIEGYAQEVWGGWVWVTNNHIEHRWSKRRTKSECEQVVREVVERLGSEAAFDEVQS
jgi:hypothetical protein